MEEKNETTQPEVEKVEVTTVKSTTSEVKSDTPNSQEDYFAIGAFVLGIFNLCSWFIPLFGCPMAIIGIILGYLGMQKSKKYKTFAVIGLVLSIIALIVTLGNAALGAYIGMTDPNALNF